MGPCHFCPFAVNWLICSTFKYCGSCAPFRNDKLPRVYVPEVNSCTWSFLWLASASEKVRASYFMLEQLSNRNGFYFSKLMWPVYLWRVRLPHLRSSSLDLDSWDKYTRTTCYEYMLITYNCFHAIRLISLAFACIKSCNTYPPFW